MTKIYNTNILPYQRSTLKTDPLCNRRLEHLGPRVMFLELVGIDEIYDDCSSGKAASDHSLARIVSGRAIGGLGRTISEMTANQYLEM